MGKGNAYYSAPPRRGLDPGTIRAMVSLGLRGWRECPYCTRLYAPDGQIEHLNSPGCLDAQKRREEERKMLG